MLATAALTSSAGCVVLRRPTTLPPADKPYVAVLSGEMPEPITMVAISCRLCEDAPCILACPRDALSRSEANGIILVNTDKCDGCGWCVEACDFGAVVLNPESRHAEICDLCVNEADGPRCVAYCPKEALSLSTPEVLRQNARRDVAAHLVESLE